MDWTCPPLMDSVWRRLVGLEWIQHYRECGYRHPLSMRSSLLRVCRTLWREERGRLWDDLGKRYLQSSPEYATLVVMFEVEVRRMVAKATRFCEGELNRAGVLGGRLCGVGAGLVPGPREGRPGPPSRLHRHDVRRHPARHLLVPEQHRPLRLPPLGGGGGAAAAAARVRGLLLPLHGGGVPGRERHPPLRGGGAGGGGRHVAVASHRDHEGTF